MLLVKVQLQIRVRAQGAPRLGHPMPNTPYRQKYRIFVFRISYPYPYRISYCPTMHLGQKNLASGGADAPLRSRAGRGNNQLTGGLPFPPRNKCFI